MCHSGDNTQGITDLIAIKDQSSMSARANQNEFRFFVLLLFLVSTLLLPPYFEGLRAFNIVWKLVLTGSLLAAMASVGGKRTVMVPGLILLVPSVLMVWVEAVSGVNTWATYLDNLTTICFLGFICFHLGRYIVQSRQVSLNIIYASLCIYLLVGLIWAAIYANMQLYFGDAFIFAHEESFTGTKNLMSQFTYFSFVTLTSLGYGDITPSSRVAQSWVVAEAIFGQFYIAVVLARLVSLHTDNSKN